MNIKQKIVDWWMSMVCPRYKEDMPTTDQIGPWVAVASTIALNGYRSEIKTERSYSVDEP